MMDDITQREFHLLRDQLGQIHGAVHRIEAAYNAHESKCQEDRRQGRRVDHYQNAAIGIVILFQCLMVGLEYLQIENLNIHLF